MDRDLRDWGWGLGFGGWGVSQVLLHEGGTLLVCLNSARAFNDPPKREHDVMYRLARMWERLRSAFGQIVKQKEEEGGERKAAFS